MAMYARAVGRYLSGRIVLEMLGSGVLLGLAGFALKAGVAELSLDALLPGIFLNPFLWAAGVMGLGGFLLMQKALHGERMTIVTPVIGGVSIALPVILAYFFLAESISPIKWAGIVLILAGVAGMGK